MLVWKVKTPSEVKAFVWTEVLNRININDLLHIQRPHWAISPVVYVMCFRSLEMHNHLFLHCQVAWYIWNQLFGIMDERWVCPADLGVFLASKFTGFGRQVFASLWCLWLEQIARVFNHHFFMPHLWERIIFMTSLGVSANGFLMGCPLWIFKGIERLGYFLIFFV